MSAEGSGVPLPPPAAALTMSCSSSASGPALRMNAWRQLLLQWQACMGRAHQFIEYGMRQCRTSECMQSWPFRYRYRACRFINARYDTELTEHTYRYRISQQARRRTMPMTHARKAGTNADLVHSEQTISFSVISRFGARCVKSRCDGWKQCRWPPRCRWSCSRAPTLATVCTAAMSQLRRHNDMCPLFLSSSPAFRVSPDRIPLYKPVSQLIRQGPVPVCRCLGDVTWCTNS